MSVLSHEPRASSLSSVRRCQASRTFLVIKQISIYLAAWGDTGSVAGWGTEILHAME